MEIQKQLTIRTHFAAIPGNFTYDEDYSAKIISYFNLQKERRGERKGERVRGGGNFSVWIVQITFRLSKVSRHNAVMWV